MSAEPTFRSVRRSRTLHFFAQAVLLLALFAGLNWLAGQSGWRFDLTARHRHALSAETLAYLKNLSAAVTITNTFDNDTDDDTRRDVAELLTEYDHAAEHNPTSRRIKIETLNVVQNAREARDRGLEGQSNVLLVQRDDRRHFVDPSELYRIEKGEKTAFLGEQALTAAILDVTNAEKKIIYFLTGHGEMPVVGPEGSDLERGLGSFGRELAGRNFGLQPLDLAQTGNVPADAAALVIAGPLGRIHPDEVVLLRSYLSKRAGRVLALLPPKVEHGLDELLDDWGILTDNVLITDPSASGQSDTGDLILTANARGDHPIIRQLASNPMQLRFGAARPAREDLGRRDGLEVYQLIGTSATAWGERDLTSPGPPVYTPGTDLRGPIAVGTASQNVQTGGRSPVPSGRLVVFGSADWAANGRIQTLGNLTLLLAAVNWLTDRDPSLSLGDVPPRPIERIQLTLSRQQLGRLRIALIFALPGATALLGLLVFWSRRR